MASGRNRTASVGRKPKIKNVEWKNGLAYARKIKAGKAYTEPLHTSDPTEARRRVAAWLREIDEGKWAEKTGKTFEDAVSLYIDEHLPRKKPATQKRYKTSILLLLDHLEGKMLDEISSADLLAFETARLRQGITGATLIRDLNCLGSIYSLAQTAELTTSNPVPAFLKAAKRSRGLSDSEPRERYLSKREEAQLIDAAWNMPKRTQETRQLLAWYIALAIESGLRDAELKFLERSDIDLHRCEITVRAANAKRSRSRRVPITQRAQDIIRSIPHHLHSNYLLARSNGIPFKDTWHPFQDAAAHAGIDDVTIHDLRRTCGCRLLQDLKMPIEQVSAWLGHKSISVTQRHYAFLGVDQLHEHLQSRKAVGGKTMLILEG